jgi:hypothetical protein
MISLFLQQLVGSVLPKIEPVYFPSNLDFQKLNICTSRRQLPKIIANRAFIRVGHL